jgi:pyridoxine 4-dehydrogenase
MLQEVKAAGSFTLPDSSLTLNRMGYGAMQLAGKDGKKLVWGPPRDPDEAVAVLREAVASGVNHIDTSDFYGPHVTNQLIRTALSPYPEGMAIVTKVGALRGEDGSWNVALSPEELTAAVHSNLRNLGVDALDVVNLRIMFDRLRPSEGSIEEPLTALAELREKGLIRHIGLSNATAAQVAEARRMVLIVCVQNEYNLAHRADDSLIDDLATAGIAYVPYFPLGGFNPLQSDILSQAAGQLGATVMQVALAWLLHRSPNILVIPGTSSRSHLRENLKAGALRIPADVLAALDRIAASHTAAQQQH